MDFDAEAVFNREFDKAIAADVERSGFPVEKWFKSGVSKPETAVETWRKRGPVCVASFIRWFESSGEQVWITPDGRPAIELELTVMFGDIEVKMVIDLITVGPLGLTIIDCKSGYKMPDSDQQLGMYACGVELAFGAQYRPLWGAYFFNRGKGPKGTALEDLTYLQPRTGLDSYRYSVAYFTQELAAFDKAAEQEIFIARPGEHCDRCGVAYACVAVGGNDSSKFDPGDPEYGVSPGATLLT
jgi:putative RecB family exonuclease